MTTIRTEPTTDPFGYEEILTRARLLTEQERGIKFELSCINQEIDDHRTTLKRAFDLICDPRDWKGPIDHLLTISNATESRDGLSLQDYLDLIREAIAFFTATETTIETTEDPWRFIIKSIGYRAGPAGDH